MIGAKIRTARKAAGLTAAQLAELVPVTTTTVLRWERGEVSPSLDYLERIADALGLVLSVELIDAARIPDARSEPPKQR
jgi:transcriptional regulator with XRE-family HTH domain